MNKVQYLSVTELLCAIKAHIQGRGRLALKYNNSDDTVATRDDAAVRVHVSDRNFSMSHLVAIVTTKDPHSGSIETS